MHTLQLYGRLIYNRIKPVIESVLPEEQAGFRPNRCTLDQVTLFTEDNEASFDKKLKSGVVFLNLSAAYDTVWYRGLTLKLLRTTPSKEMVRGLIGMISQRSFHVDVGKSESSCRTLLSGVPQGSVTLHLFSVCMITIFSQHYRESTYMQMTLPLWQVIIASQLLSKLFQTI